MMFYEIIEKNYEEIFKQLPKSICSQINKLKTSEFIRIKLSDKGPLEEIWEVTKHICKEYIDNEWVSYLEIDNLTEDIKFHIIFSTYLSIKEKKITDKKVEEVAGIYSEYYGERKYPLDFEKNFRKRFNKWVENNRATDSFTYSDLEYYLTYEDNDKDKDKDKDYTIRIDYYIFYQIIDQWRNCPFNKKNEFGMDFTKLNKFYVKFKDYLEKDYEMISYKENEYAESDDTRFNSNKAKDLELIKLIKVFNIERLFNFEFINEIYEYICNKYDDELEKTKNKEFARYREAERLFILSPIATIPMVFCRNRYLDKFNNKYENYEKDICLLYTELSNSIYYLNYCLIPLLAKVYYCLLDEYKLISNNKSENFIFHILIDYINKNYNKNCVKNINLNKNDKNKALEVNVTYKVFNQMYYRNEFYEGDDIFEIMSNIEDYKHQDFLECENVLGTYVNKFPYNTVYSNYLEGKQKEKIEKENKKENDKKSN